MVRAVQSLRNSRFPTGIVVVDNAPSASSHDQLAPWIDEWLPMERNLGFAEAINRAAQSPLASSADYLFLLNQDAEVFPDTLAKLVAHAESHPRYGILSGLHWANRTGTLDGNFGRHLRRRRPWLYWRLKNRRYAVDPVVSVPFVNAAAWLVRRDCWNKVGGFDAAYFLYEEDVDFCEKARARGFEVGLVPGAAVLHHRYRAPGASRAPYWQCRSSLQRTLRKTRGVRRALHVLGWLAYRLALCAWPNEEVRFMDLWRAAKDVIG